MNEFEKIAHLIRFGLSFQKMTTKTVIEWADRKILEDSVEQIYFDISTAGNSHKIIESLSKVVKWNFTDSEIRGLVLSYYKEFLNANLVDWIEIQKELIYYYESLSYNDSDSSLADFLYYLRDDIEVRKLGYNGTLNMPEYLIMELDSFDNYKVLIQLLNENGLTGFEIKIIN